MTTDTTTLSRRAISRQARDAFPPMGIYIIRDKETGDVLVASSRNVHGAMNRAQFELRLRSHANKALQAEWNRSGPGRFDFEIVELLKEREDSNFDYLEELRTLEQIYREQYEQQAGAAR
ncbi:GIY-YIG nuclease family protein [Noviherbaspirillum galbum]|uniref:GIY-YIG nuclease family protein n=1 Tax=Noviherbaspirillum galbum TaxID=2709383 RepID=A0A6B3SUX1_9BURK|nr:GIY-YIG nuclease family protein [Noviherbaspirillum galbum]NEX64850.1 GIY-YIG nuclease family protein [Noviherbaspirillum galbum]